MSLINDALKKVQRQHANQPTAEHGAAGSSHARKPRASGAQALILIGAGAAVLIVLSVIITVLIVNRTPEPTRPAVITAAPAAPTATVDSNAPSPVIVPPIIGGAPAEKIASEPATIRLSLDHALSVPATANPLPATAPAPVILVRSSAPDPRVLAFVDAIRVTGIRSSGNESKVLMNERVYRVNDIVERLLNVKLVKVEPDRLTFTDENEVVYTKNF